MTKYIVIESKSDDYPIIIGTKDRLADAKILMLDRYTNEIENRRLLVTSCTHNDYCAFVKVSSTHIRWSINRIDIPLSGKAITQNSIPDNDENESD